MKKFLKAPQFLLAFFNAAAGLLPFVEMCVFAFGLFTLTGSPVMLFGSYIGMCILYIKTMEQLGPTGGKIIIRKGHHYPFPFFQLFKPIVFWKKETTIEREFMFTKSCLDSYDGDEDYFDINKLFGFSLGRHHKNSFRIGWRSNFTGEVIRLYAYYYIDGVRHSGAYMGSVPIDKMHKMSITLDKDLNSIIFQISGAFFDKVVSLEKERNNKLPWFGYMLGAYFGGNKKAPKDITIIKK